MIPPQGAGISFVAVGATFAHSSNEGITGLRDRTAPASTHLDRPTVPGHQGSVTKKRDNEFVTDEHERFMREA